MLFSRWTMILPLIVAGVLFVSNSSVACTKSKIPEEAKALENPLEASDEVLAAAKKVYKKKCKKCHGTKGNGKGPGAKDMDPMPPDWTAGIKLTDGELFWSTMNGCEGTEMKGWKAGSAKPGKEITDEEGWALVHYIKAFAK